MNSNTNAVEASVVPSRLSPARGLQAFRSYIPSVVAIIALLILGQVLSNGFASMDNIGSILTQASLLTIAAIGQSMVIFAGDFGIDLSVGPVMSMGALIGSMISMGENSMMPLTIAILILIGAFIGAINGLCVQKIGIPALAMTLVMATVVDGFTFLYTKGQPGVMVAPMLMSVGRPLWGPVRTLMIIALIAIVVMEIILRKSRFGKKLYLVGNNRKAAKLSGIKVNKVVVIAFILCSVFAALAGLLLVGYTGSGQLKMGGNYTMLSIAAVVIGGARVAGGKGTIIGAFLGSVVLVLLASVLTAVGMPQGTRNFLQGALLLIILVIQCRSKRLRQ